MIKIVKDDQIILNWNLTSSFEVEESCVSFDVISLFPIHEILLGETYDIYFKTNTHEFHLKQCFVKEISSKYDEEHHMSQTSFTCNTSQVLCSDLDEEIEYPNAIYEDDIDWATEGF